MEKKRPGPRYSPVLPVLALAVILAGLFAMSGVFTESQRQLLDGQDGQLTKTAQSVDNNILGHFVWYCSIEIRLFHGRMALTDKNEP